MFPIHSIVVKFDSCFLQFHFNKNDYCSTMYQLRSSGGMYGTYFNHGGLLVGLGWCQVLKSPPPREQPS